MNTRSKIIATVVILWIAVLGVIAFQTLSTDETKRVAPTTNQQFQIDVCVRTELLQRGEVPGGEWESHYKIICRQKILPTPAYEPDYDAAGAAVKAAAASLIALVIVGATIIWTRPKANEQVVASAPTASPPAPKPKVAPTPAPTAETVASSAADPASALRQLKALHDEGILTDDEYETKRKALTDQL